MTSSERSVAPSLLSAVRETLFLDRAIEVLTPVSSLLRRCGSASSFKELQVSPLTTVRPSLSCRTQEALLFISDNSAAHRIATLRFFAQEEEPRSQLDVSYIGTGKVSVSPLL